MIEREILNSDLDLFCLINNHPVHIASAGGYVPSMIMVEGYILNYTKILKALAKRWPVEDEIITNPELRYIIKYDENRENIHLILNTLFHNQTRELSDEELYNFYEEKIYAHSFIEMARLGFLSYDKTNLGLPEDDAFHLVARPRLFNSLIARIFCITMRVPRFYVKNFNVGQHLILNSLSHNIYSYR